MTWLKRFVSVLQASFFFFPSRLRTCGWCARGRAATRTRAMAATTMMTMTRLRNEKGDFEVRRRPDKFPYAAAFSLFLCFFLCFFLFPPCAAACGASSRSRSTPTTATSLSMCRHVLTLAHPINPIHFAVRFHSYATKK
ncbi:hypothetical protein DFH11DRAFT_1884677 [Phellopilus nigrolimitatus]|nr:hypothetical protein DFH11DRAFT_1884677 [Phellopilus nigrolimitatus]